MDKIQIFFIGYSAGLFFTFVLSRITFKIVGTIIGGIKNV